MIYKSFFLAVYLINKMDVDILRYFDYAATTPIDSDAQKIWIEASQRYFGNSTSLHDIGTNASGLLDLSRQQLADILGVRKESVVFTSGGTESNILALETFLASRNRAKNHIMISQTEHASLANYVKKLAETGYEITYLQHLADGRIDLEHLYDNMNEQTCMVIVQHVNSETGVIQPIIEIGQITQERGIFLHVDCVQSFGKFPLQTICALCDSISISSHKVYGPKGVGAVIFPKIGELTPPIPNMTHEAGFRAGTVNVPGIAAFITAANAFVDQQSQEFSRVKTLRDLCLNQLFEHDVDVQVIESSYQSPYILALTCRGLQGQYMMLELNRMGFCISTGSACQIGKQEPSKTMIALGKSEEEAHQLIRISFGKHTTEEDVQNLCQCIIEIITVS